MTKRWLLGWFEDLGCLAHFLKSLGRMVETTSKVCGHLLIAAKAIDAHIGANAGIVVAL